MDEPNEADFNDPAVQGEDVDSSQGAEHQDAVDQVLESRDEEMERLRETADSADMRVLKAQAEAENFRKRLRRDFEDQVKYASVPLVNDILEVRDNLLRGLEAAGNAADAGGLQEGVAMVVKQLDDFLTKHSVLPIPTEGEQFDPNFHEAISQMPSEHESGMVAHVAQSGFKMHDRVVRPSQVVVSTGPAE
ncbi:nucleotide exchange factor GrpE [bacterium]|nr:nucleotide exchange factor GrpE [Rubripirellula sp.]MDB4506127.1 nucleotide exchange factor GrpE [bacterium]MDB4645127.1 nucleotide exchange factor GrpE [Rubripirellula sp.]MDB4770583.1 nucleotide exchange factor GrpE [bacterium]